MVQKGQHLGHNFVLFSRNAEHIALGSKNKRVVGISHFDTNSPAM
jgi:hypothetical protein